MKRKAKPAVETVKKAAPAVNKISARVIQFGPIQKSDGTSKAKPVEETAFMKLVTDGKIIQPPQNLYNLAKLPQQNSILQPLVSAMETNIHGFGHRFSLLTGFRRNLDKLEEDDPLKEEVENERLKLRNFFRNANPDGSFTKLCRIKETDEETTGNAYWEIIRHPVTKSLQLFKHMPSYQVRLGFLSKENIEYTKKITTIQKDGSLKIQGIKLKRRFRNFVQVAESGQKLVWFKEYEDPRVMDCRTGVYEDATSKKYQATELRHWKIYAPGTAYGLPRYMGNYVAIHGERAADEVNFFTLSNNNVPNVILKVSGGKLTQGSIDRMKQFLKISATDARNYSRILLLESESADTKGAKIEIEPLLNQQIQDQLWIEYSKSTAERVRISFRLPPIFIGKSDDYTRSTAETSRKLADEQIFSPERNDWDDDMNRDFMPELDARYHEYKSNSPNVTDDKDLIQVLVAAEKTGAMTPRIAHMIVTDILNQELPPIDPDKLDPDIPMSIQLAEKIKNLGFQEAGGVGNQVAAFKSMDSDDLMLQLMDLRERLDMESLRRR